MRGKKKTYPETARDDYKGLEGLDQEEKLKRIISGNPMIYTHLNLNN